jgi:hypothetical protein
MSVLALSAAETTGVFTLAGAVVGAIVGGSLTLVLEILRRRWHLQDVTGDAIKERHSEIAKERKETYSQLLAKGIELGYIATEMGVSNIKSKSALKDQGDQQSFEDRVTGYMSQLFTAQNPLNEFENLRARVEMIAGETVARLTNEWDKYLNAVFSAAIINGRPIPNIKDPYKSLVQAMKKSLDTILSYLFPSLSSRQALAARLEAAVGTGRFRLTGFWPYGDAQRRQTTRSSDHSFAGQS